MTGKALNMLYDSNYMWCPYCQKNNCMKVGGVGPPKTFYLDTYGQIGYICKNCGARGWGPGTSPGLICSYEKVNENIIDEK